jgi:hypothetical protein
MAKYPESRLTDRPKVRVRPALIPVFLLLLTALGPGCARTPSRQSPTAPSNLVTTAASAAVCTYTLTLERTTFDQFGGTSTMRVTATPVAGQTPSLSCQWTLTAPNWIKPTQNSGGSGTTDVALSVAPYVLARAGTVQIGDQLVSVQQEPHGEVGQLKLREPTHACAPPTAGEGNWWCSYTVLRGQAPTSSNISVCADLSQFGNSKPACGMVLPIGSPTEADFDLFLHIPAGTAPRTYSFPINLSDAEGRTATGTGTLTVVQG